MIKKLIPTKATPKDIRNVVDKLNKVIEVVNLINPHSLSVEELEGVTHQFEDEMRKHARELFDSVDWKKFMQDEPAPQPAEKKCLHRMRDMSHIVSGYCPWGSTPAAEITIEEYKKQLIAEYNKVYLDPLAYYGDGREILYKVMRTLDEKLRQGEECKECAVFPPCEEHDKPSRQEATEKLVKRYAGSCAVTDNRTTIERMLRFFSADLRKLEE